MIRKCLVVGIILLFVGVTIAPAIAQNTEESQSTSKGTWLYVGGSGPGNYTRIQDALDDASRGDTVYVFSGIYRENIEIRQYEISLIGENSHTTIIDGRGDFWVVHIMPQTWGVRIQNFTIQNCSPGFFGPAGIILDAYTNESIISENIFNVSATGVQLYYGNHFNTIKNNTFYKCDVGIQLDSACHENKIIQNNIRGERDYFLRKYCYGIYLDHWSYTNEIYGNIVSLNYYGILDEASGYENNIHNNVVEKNTFGIYLTGSTHDNSIFNNKIIKNLYGIILDHVSKNTVQNNFISLNVVGILIRAGTDNIIRDNTFRWNIFAKITRPHPMD